MRSVPEGQGLQATVPGADDAHVIHHAERHGIQVVPPPHIRGRRQLVVSAPPHVGGRFVAGMLRKLPESNAAIGPVRNVTWSLWVKTNGRTRNSPSEAHVVLAFQPRGSVRELDVAVAKELGASRLRRHIDRLAQKTPPTKGRGRVPRHRRRCWCPAGPAGRLQLEGAEPARSFRFCTQPKRELFSQFEPITIVEAGDHAVSESLETAQGRDVRWITNIQLAGLWNQIALIGIPAHELHFARQAMVESGGDRVEGERHVDFTAVAGGVQAIPAPRSPRASRHTSPARSD